MLILSWKQGQVIQIGPDVFIRCVRNVKTGYSRIGIVAPREIDVVRRGTMSVEDMHAKSKKEETR